MYTAYVFKLTTVENGKSYIGSSRKSMSIEYVKNIPYSLKYKFEEEGINQDFIDIVNRVTESRHGDAKDRVYFPDVFAFDILSVITGQDYSKQEEERINQVIKHMTYIQDYGYNIADCRTIFKKT